MKKTILSGGIAVVIASLAFLVWQGRSSSEKIEVIHTVSYSNAAVFLAIQEDKENLERFFVPDPGKHVEALLASSGSRPSVSITPFSNALIALARNPDLVIIGGSGLNGLSLLSSAGPELDDLQDKKIGTARGDSLELFVYEAMNGRAYIPEYFTDPFLLVTAAKRVDIQGVTHVEPFATELVNFGLARLLTSRDFWGDHPDAVVVTTKQDIENFRPQLIQFLRTLLQKEREIEANPKNAAAALASFYNMPSSKLEEILGLQEPQIDIRKYVPFFDKRITTLRKLNYIDSDADLKQPFDWSLLEEALGGDS